MGYEGVATIAFAENAAFLTFVSFVAIILFLNNYLSAFTSTGIIHVALNFLTLIVFFLKITV